MKRGFCSDGATNPLEPTEAAPPSSCCVPALGSRVQQRQEFIRIKLKATRMHPPFLEPPNRSHAQEIDKQDIHPGVGWGGG